MKYADSVLTTTLEALSSQEEKFLKINGTEASFLGLEDNSIIALLKFSDDRELGNFSLPPNLEIQFVSGEMEFSNHNHWLQISFPKSSMEFFSKFLLHCIDRVERNPKIETVRRVLLEWRKHWRFLSSDLTLEERVGLFGELFFLKFALTNSPNFSWKYWQAAGEVSGLHDFISNEYRIEVKTTTKKQDGEIHVFDSEQFYARDNLYLCTIILNTNSSGDNLEDLCEDVLRLVEPADFAELRDILKPVIMISQKHHEERYSFHTAKFIRVMENGPFLQLNDLKERSVSHVQYSMKIEDIPFDREGEMDDFTSFL